MKKLSKIIGSLGLAGLMLAGSVLTGCGDTADYSAEIREYQNRLESLAAENEELKSQLGITEEASENPSETPAESVSAETESDTQTAVSGNNAPDEQAEAKKDDNGTNKDEITKILVLGDSIWGNVRDHSGVAEKVKDYMERMGYAAEVYNAAIGGTRATLDPQDNQYEFGPASENSLAKMVSILDEKTDVEQLQGKAAYEDMKAALEIKDEIDVVIISYGMNDFLSQVPINTSDNRQRWTAYGTALKAGIGSIRRILPEAKVLITAPSYASYFSIPVVNMGERALYNYASVACDVAKGEETLCMDAYNNIGIDTYTADDYLEDGVHLNEKGRDLYARGIVSCLLYGREGQVSGNMISFD